MEDEEYFTRILAGISPDICNPGLLREVAKGNLEAAKNFVQLKFCQYIILITALKFRQTEIIDFLIQDRDFICGHPTTHLCIRFADLKTLQLAHETYGFTLFEGCFEEAIFSNSEEILLWLMEKNVHCSQTTLDYVFAFRNFKGIKWLIETKSLKPQHINLDDFEDKDLEFLQLVHKHKYAKFEKRLCNFHEGLSQMKLHCWLFEIYPKENVEISSSEALIILISDQF